MHSWFLVPPARFSQTAFSAYSMCYHRMHLLPSQCTFRPYSSKTKATEGIEGPRVAARVRGRQIFDHWSLSKKKKKRVCQAPVAKLNRKFEKLENYESKRIKFSWGRLKKIFQSLQSNWQMNRITSPLLSEKNGILCLEAS